MQPDIVVLGAKKGTILELKTTRCADAEIQLKQQYLPICSLLWPSWTFSLVEVFKTFAGQDRPKMVRSLKEALEAEGFVSWQWIKDVQ